MTDDELRKGDTITITQYREYTPRLPDPISGIFIGWAGEEYVISARDGRIYIGQLVQDNDMNGGHNG